jgi:hypothetical protein
MELRRACLVIAISLLVSIFALAQTKEGKPRNQREIAARFAPDFYQALGNKPRFDYITNFNFDGNWRADDNWENADDSRLPLRAYVYHSVIETSSHYFITYAVFHPRDYKGGERGALLSELLRQGEKLGGKYDPTGKLGEAAFAHENDFEGCLVVVAKAQTLEKSQVVYVETISHNRYLKYVTAYTVPASATLPIVHLNQSHPELYIEPKGHGIEALNSNYRSRESRTYITYLVGENAGDPDATRDSTVTYELLSLMDDIWPRAQSGVNETYGEARDYRDLKLQALVTAGGKESRGVKAPAIGSAFAGKVGMPNAARPPWGWFDGELGINSAGAWFFDPAGTIKQHFNLGTSFSTVYTVNEFLTAEPSKPDRPAPKTSASQ